ncbi:MAG TPA: MFS transporter [Acidimicrobiia bacterium]
MPPEDAPSPRRVARARRALGRLTVDVAPLRISRDFRLLMTGELVSETGSQITLVALFIQVFQLTGSALAVGAIGLVQLAALVVTTFFASPLIDRVDRRRLLIISQCLQATMSLVLLGGALAKHPPLALVYTAGALAAGLAGFSLSTRSAITPMLMPASQLSNALAINQVMWNTCLIAGPAIGGVIVGQAGLPWAYGIDAASFGATIVAAILMRPLPPRHELVVDDPDSESNWQRLLEGFRYLRGRRVLQSTFIVDLIAMIFGMPRALFPILALVQFHQGDEVVGALFSAAAVGALLGALTSGWVERVRRQGLAVLVAVSIWGLAIAAFGLTGPRLWLALSFLAVAGGADVISAVFRSTILQLSVPDDLRGRMSAVHILVVTGGPRLGDFEAGLVAALFTPAIAVVSGGLACVAGVGVLALAVPEFARYRAPIAGHQVTG